MDNNIAVFYKIPDNWVMEFKEQGDLRKIKWDWLSDALNFYFLSHPEIKMFAIVPLSLPQKEGKNGDNDNATEDNLETKGMPKMQRGLIH
jgi:hypothetical protein